MCVFWFTPLSTVFQSYHDGVWLLQGATCRLGGSHFYTDNSRFPCAFICLSFMLTAVDFSRTQQGYLGHGFSLYYRLSLRCHRKSDVNTDQCENDYAPSEDSDQPGHPPSLIWVFAVRSVGSLGPKLSSCGQRRLWSVWADAQADLSLRWAHMPFCWFCPEAAHIWTCYLKTKCLILTFRVSPRSKKLPTTAIIQS